MPKLDAITVAVFNGQGPTFTPASNQSGLSTWYDYEGAQTPAALPKLTVSVSQPSKTSKLFKTRVKLAVPVPKQDVNGVVINAVDHQNSVDITFLSADSATKLERTFLLNAAVGLLQNALLKEVVEDARSIY